MTRLEDLKQFYKLLDRLEKKIRGRRQLKNCSSGMEWPMQGVYYFFEENELRSNSGQGLRVVRVGTHALNKDGKVKLWDRLIQHRGREDGEGGNHRASVFRKHIGAAINKKKGNAAVSTWGEKSAPIKQGEAELEREVSLLIGDMPFLWLAINDEPGQDSDRKYVEVKESLNNVSILSNRTLNFKNSVLDFQDEAGFA